MQFDRSYALAADTPADALAEAWGLSAADAQACSRKERPMTIREAGALAELHGLKLLDVLAV